MSGKTESNLEQEILFQQNQLQASFHQLVNESEHVTYHP